MTSQLASKHADKCRFCWMCRHLCPVQLQTGKEINTPRAKGLLLSMTARGKEFDSDMAQAMYECLLCDACTNDCATGYQPPLFIREARTEAVVNGLAPKAVMDLVDNIEKTGNIYGKEKPSFGTENKGEVLVYIGEAAAFNAPAMAKAFLSLLSKAGVSYMVLKEEPASGVMLGDLAGYVEEVQQQAKHCADAVNESGAKTVVVLDSYDEEIMKQKYPEWGCEIKADIISAVAYAAKLVEDGKLVIKGKAEGVAAYHDDDRSARTFHEFAPARELAKKAGYELIEMFNKEKLAKSCGSTVANAYMPEIVKKTASGRWDDLLRTNAEVMITANPESYECLALDVPEGKKLVDLFEVLDSIC